MYCRECGNKLSDNAQFCNKCGGKIEKNNSNQINTNNKNGLKTASIVLGILGIISGLTILFSIPGFILSLIGLILGICSTKKGKNILGIVLSAIGLFISIISTILSIFIFNYVFDYLKIDLDNFLTEEKENFKNKYDFSSIDLDLLYENGIPIEKVLNKIDKIILDKKYPETNKMKEEIDEILKDYYNMNEQYYGYTKEELLNAAGFNNEKDFIDSLKLDYRRNKYIEEYLKNKLTEEEIDTYYRENVFGDINSKHILVQVSDDGYSDSEARKIANEIIKKLNSGYTWEEVIDKYKDKIISEELGYRSFNDNLEYEYVNECRLLEVGKYSKIPVKTSYGYHIIYKIDQKERPELKEVKNILIDELISSKLESDNTLYLKILINLREEAGFSFKDSAYEYQYEKYIETYN